MRASIHPSSWTCRCGHPSIRPSVHTRRHADVHTHIHTSMHAHVGAYLHTCMHACSLTYLSTCILRMFVHIHICSDECLQDQDLSICRHKLHLGTVQASVHSIESRRSVTSLSSFSDIFCVHEAIRARVHLFPCLVGSWLPSVLPLLFRCNYWHQSCSCSRACRKIMRKHCASSGHPFSK